jgi:hypothetical protein
MLWTIGVAVFTAKHFAARFATMQSATGGNGMRHIVLAIVLAAGVSLIGSVAASAAPANGQAMAQAVKQTDQITPAAGGCGRGWHRGRYGHCHRN